MGRYNLPNAGGVKPFWKEQTNEQTSLFGQVQEGLWVFKVKRPKIQPLLQKFALKNGVFGHFERFRIKVQNKVSQEIKGFPSRISTHELSWHVSIHHGVIKTGAESHKQSGRVAGSKTIVFKGTKIRKSTTLNSHAMSILLMITDEMRFLFFHEHKSIPPPLLYNPRCHHK